MKGYKSMKVQDSFRSTFGLFKFALNCPKIIIVSKT